MDFSKPKIKVSLAGATRLGQKLVATASVEFGNTERNGLRIYGFKILKGGQYNEGFTDGEGGFLYVMPPSFPSTAGGYKDLIYLARPLFEVLKKSIPEEYLATIRSIKEKAENTDMG